MAVESDKDRLALLSDFGQQVVFKRRGTTTLTTLGIFHKTAQYLDADGALITTHGIGLTLTAKAAEQVALEDTAVVGTSSYTVTAIHDDGEGMATIELQKS